MHTDVQTGLNVPCVSVCLSLNDLDCCYCFLIDIDIHVSLEYNKVKLKYLHESMWIKKNAKIDKLALRIILASLRASLPSLAQPHKGKI